MIRILGIKLLILTSLFAKEFYISFQAFSSNNILIYSHFTCSEAVVNINFGKKLLFSIDCNESIKKCCNKYRNFIVQNLLKEDVFIFSNDTKTYKSISSNTKLTYLPHLFDIILKDNRLYFYIKDDK